MTFIVHTSFVHSSLQMSDLLSQEIVVISELFDLTLQVLGLLLGANAEFFDDFEDSPETHDNDQRGDFFNGTMQDNVGDEACNDDECIETVKPRFEIAKGVRFRHLSYVVWGSRTSNQMPKLKQSVQP